MALTTYPAYKFVVTFNRLGQNRMYPIGYRRESSMRKITLDHVGALSHAEVYIRPAISPNMSPHHRLEIEKDLERLADIKLYLLRTIYEPGLPLTTEIPEHPESNGNKGHPSNSRS